MVRKNITVEELRAALLDESRIPSLPTIVQDILAVAEDPRSGVKDVEKVVEKDQSCSIKLLKLSNSAYYGFSRQISTIKQAILIIGLEGVKSTAMGLEMAQCFLKGAKGGEEVLGKLWVHSMAVATAAQILAKRSKATTEAFAYLSGLVHDFGKVVLAGHFAEDYVEVFKRAKEEKVPIALMEQSEFGVDHETVASWVAEAWDLPDAIREIAKNHHKGYHLEQTNKAILLVGLADAVAYASGVGDGGNGRPPRVDAHFLHTFGASMQIGEEVVAELRKNADRFSAMLTMAN